MSKMTVAEKANVRSNVYGMVEGALAEQNIAFEAIATGLLATLEDGTFVEIKVVVKDEEKFDLDMARMEYAEKCQKAAERAEKAAQSAEKRAQKEKEKAAKAKENADKAE